MAGIAAIVSVIALFTALCALWMVAEAVKKMDTRSRRVMENHMKGLRGSFSELARMTQKNSKTQEALINRMRDVVKSREVANLEIDNLKRQVEALKGRPASVNPEARRKA